MVVGNCILQLPIIFFLRFSNERPRQKIGTISIHCVTSNNDNTSIISCKNVQ